MHQDIGKAQSNWCYINAGVAHAGDFVWPPLVLSYIHITDPKSVLDIAKYVDDSTVWEVCDRKLQ